MANNGTSDPVTSILSAIESVREEIVGLRADLAGPSASVNAPVAAVARKNPWASLPASQRAEKIAKMKQGRNAKKAAGESARPPTDWRLFSDRVRSLLRNAGYSGNALGVESQQFAASLKDEEADLSAWSDEEILARRAAWSPPSVVKSVVNALPAPPVAAAQAPADGFQRVMLHGNQYFVNLATGHTYRRQANGSMGEWAGIFSKTPKPHINTSVPKPLGGGKRKSTHKHKRRHAKTRKH
jgi:hypothetical protein